MDTRQARDEYRAGHLREVVIEPSREGNGWMLLVRDEDGALETITNPGGTAKIYHSLDRATADAKALGFETVRIEEPF